MTIEGTIAEDTVTMVEPRRPIDAGNVASIPRSEWPTATTTWLRYCYIGRWNYTRGIALAALIGLAGSAIFGWGFMGFALGVALLYVAMSFAGLWLLYGPPSERIFRQLMQMVNASGKERVLDVHFGTYRASRALLELLPAAKLFALGVHDPEHESEPAVLDVWKFERPPVSHPRFEEVEGDVSSFGVSDHEVDLVVLGFGIHELHSDEEKSELVREILRVLAPNGKLILFERGWSPLLAFVFGPLFLHFTPAKAWDTWLRKYFEDVDRTRVFGMVDVFAASGAK